MFCGKCGTKIDISTDSNEEFVTCPNCKSNIKLPVKRKEIKESPVAETKVTESKVPEEKTEIRVAVKAEEKAAVKSVVKESPQKVEAKIITAGKLQIGTNCSICKQPINIGDKIYICNFCKSTNHEQCWQEHGGCPVAECAGKLTPEERAARTQVNLKPKIDPNDMVGCKWCGEPMRRGASLCPSCGKSQSSKSVDEDDNSYYKFDDSPPLDKKEYALIFIVPVIGFKMPNWPLLFLFFAIPIMFGLFHIKNGSVSKGKKFIKTTLIYEFILMLPTIFAIIIALTR